MREPREFRGTMDAEEAPEGDDAEGDEGDDDDDRAENPGDEEEGEAVDEERGGGGGLDPEALADLASQIDSLTLGAPFVFSNAADVEEATCTIKCEGCGTKSRFDLMSLKNKRCPRCKRVFTHALIVAPKDDTEIVGAVVTQVLRENGVDVGDDDDES